MPPSTTPSATPDGPAKKRHSSLRPRLRYAAYRVQNRTGGVVPQWLKTALAGFLWFLCLPFYTLIVSPFSTFVPGLAFALGLFAFSLMAVFLWPPRTPAWRTIIWVFLASCLTGLAFKSANLPQWALAASALVGFGIVGLRINENGRKVWRRWRAHRDPLYALEERDRARKGHR